MNAPNVYQQHVLRQVANNYKLTPMTLACKLNPRIIPAKHLMYIAAKVAAAIARGNGRILISVPPRHGKPIGVDELILMGDGTYKRLGDIEVGDMVITHKGHARRVTAVHEQGILPAVKITTRANRQAVAALDHPFLTQRGWIEAGKLTVNDTLAIVKPSIEATNRNMLDEEFRLAGYFIGDGACGWNQKGSSCNANITCADPEELADIQKCADALGFTLKYSARYNYQLSGGIRDWLRKVDLAGSNTYTKEVPEWVFTAPVHQAMQFVGAYFACDGSIDRLGPQRTPVPSMSSVSLELLKGIQSLLLRAGIVSNLSDSCTVGYRLNVGQSKYIKLFRDLVPIPGVKSAKLSGLVDQFFAAKQRTYKQQVLPEQYFDDAIKSLEMITPVECRCLTVAEDETFCVRDIVVHNSELITKNTPIWALENFGNKNVILTSYGAELSTDFGRKIRDLVQSNTSLLDLRIRKDARQVGNWLTDTDGAMMSVGLGGAITGRGADILLIDDYIKSIKEALSKTTRDYIWDWFITTAYTRIEPGGTCIIIATRWHDDDLIGRILKDDIGRNRWEYIRIPAIAEEDDVLGRMPGEALFPERYPIQKLLEIKEQMGSFYFNALFQQNPENENAKLTDVAWLQYTSDLPDLYVCKTARIWDFAATPDAGDYTVGTGIAYNPRLDTTTITDIRRGQYTPNRTEELVCKTAREDGPNCTILIEQEPGASGKQLVAHYQTILPQFKVIGVPVTDGKLARSQPFLAACEARRVFLLKAPWNKAFTDEFKTFPNGDHDDQVDTASMGYAHLSMKKALSASWGRTAQENTGAYYGERKDPRLEKRSAGIVFGR